MADSSQAHTHPLTLHINNGKGTTVVQVQPTHQISQLSNLTKKSSGSEIFRKSGEPLHQQQQQPQSIFQSNMAVPSSAYCHSGPSSSSLQAQTQSRIFPTSISLPNPATTYFYQDQLSAFHNLVALQQSAAAVAAAANSCVKPTTSVNFNTSASLFNTATKYLTPAPFSTDSSNSAGNSAHTQSLNRFGLQGNTTPVAMMPGKPQSSPCNPSLAYSTGVISSYTHQPHSLIVGSSPSTSNAAAGQSPRPSILRKRTADNNTVLCASKRLAYESVAPHQQQQHHGRQTMSNMQRFLNIGGNVHVVEEATAKASTNTVEQYEAGNSNHSSSASTISAGSSAVDPMFALDYSTQRSADQSSSSTLLPITSPSPRKRQRKQRLDELPPDTNTPTTRSLAPSPLFAPPPSHRHLISMQSPNVIPYDFPPIRKPLPHSPFPSVDMSNKQDFTGSKTGDEPLPTANDHRGLLANILPIKATDGHLNDLHKPSHSRSNESMPIKVEIKEEKSDYAASGTSSSSTRTPESKSPAPDTHGRGPLLWHSLENESGWQPRRNHFRTIREIRLKEDAQSSQKGNKTHGNFKTPNINELCNHKQIYHRLDDWRLHLIKVNLSQLLACQESNKRALKALLSEKLYACGSTECNDQDDEKDASAALSLDEAFLTNLQRCSVVEKRLSEVQCHLTSILSHRKNAESLVQKYSTKRTVRKKSSKNDA